MSNALTAEEAKLSSELEKKLKQDASAKDTFCNCWPCARDVLQLLLKLPGLPKQVADAIKIIIAVGDEVSSKLCKR